jgi:bifunctional UDP-N-acetylglucosamine pyrophosphorylase/glucosamine-1-phosphate N-acetyltransferase
MRDSTVGQDSVIEPYSVLDGATVGNGCRVGPFARLRPGTVLGDGARVGNFVEIKNSRLGRKAKANHLAYVGDAEVGDGANIGAGAVTCNYDGEQSTAPKSAKAPSSAAIRCWWRRSRSAPTRRPAPDR